MELIKKRRKKMLIASLVMVALVCTYSVAFACEHEFYEGNVVSPATCTEVGCIEVRCLDCNALLKSDEIPMEEHTFGEDVVVFEPSANKDGEGIHTCSTCGLEEKFAIVCPHETVTSQTVLEPTCAEFGVASVTCDKCGTMWEKAIDKLPHNEAVFNLIEPSCFKEGLERVYCKTCDVTVEERNVDKTECTYETWHISKYATPFTAGDRYRICGVCGNKQTEEYAITMENNSVYIPSAGMHCKFAVTKFTQSAVDGNDVIYTENAYSETDPSNPFILGHWYGSMKDLHKTKIGQFVYVCRDGVIDTYEVLTSEYAKESNRHFITGQTTGVDIWDFYGSQSNAAKTCYSRVHEGTDHMPDENDGKTLHLYTCHYGKDKPGWNSKDGNLGRWIVMANLVDSQPVPVA